MERHCAYWGTHDLNMYRHKILPNDRSWEFRKNIENFKNHQIPLDRSPKLHTQSNLNSSTLVVSKSHGIDSPLCGDKALPCKTLKFAVVNISKKGDTILVEEGLYKERNISLNHDLNTTTT